ncbi:YbaN family protein [Temperatibacter marinus]|uniref:YbaN family protein n=1 Tax=Temperatibacter marinus TaxID=1456591 RepID=A0AA52HBS4_9PROT|nr:YbaN family protein [Temperatibacter marinus]WND04055.1 YbaN family protein [Temperatibacter marinus]
MKIFFVTLGLLSLGLGLAGILLPLLPATPFFLLSAYLFARSSKPLHDWMLAHRIFGPIIQNWRENKSISLYGKVSAMIAIFATFIISILLDVPSHVLLIQGVTLSLVSLFILTRNAPPKNDA